MEKFLTVFVVIVAIFSAVNCTELTLQEFMQHGQMIRKTCLEKHKTTPELIDGISKGEFPDDKTLKCYVMCGLEGMELVKNGKMDFVNAESLIKDAMPKELKAGTQKAVNNCKTAGDGITDSCDYAYALVKCWKKEDPQFRFP